jgi:hypothetical protein
VGRFARPRGDDGAMAVFVCLLLVFVLLPATGLALTSYTRSAVQAEKVRAADSGALAGAASLALLDSAALPANPLQAVSKDGLAFVRACQAALTAAGVDDSLSRTYATPVGAGCGAVYSPDPALGACAGAILDAVEALPLPVTPPVTVTNPVQPPPITLPGIGPVPSQTLPSLPPSVTVDPRAVLRQLTPALLHNGIRVTMRYRVKGPLDGLIGRDTTERTAVSTARRRFKPLLPQSLAGLPVGEVATALALRQLVDDVEEVALDNPGGVLPAPCLPAAKELFDDLDDALQVNEDPQDQDLLTCLGAVIAGLDTSGQLANVLPSVDLDCTDQLFRAQLAPNA